MQDKPNFYITTTLPYVNAKPHIGFAMEVIRADAIARFMRKMGKNVFFNTGTDEHGVKIALKAEEEGVTPQQLVDKNAELYKQLMTKLSISNDAFIRTTDKHHIAAAQEFWKKCDEAGFIEKQNYSGLYCRGCELFKTDRDLVDGKCVDHPTTPLEQISEENYFFKYSKFAEKLLALYEQKDFVIPEFRLNEIKHQIKEGLEDFSISRVKEKMQWGIPVPGDDTQVMYVWFDALVNYISTIGWSYNMIQFNTFWNPEISTMVQICGKDNLRQQSAMWQAMLCAANLPTTSHILINGFITVDGQKMSKSLGNVIDPIQIVDVYGADAFRYFMIRELSPHEDGDFNQDRFRDAYNANLANGIGNLTNRILKMAQDNISKDDVVLSDELPQDYIEKMYELNLHRASEITWNHIAELDKHIQATEPFKLVKTDPEEGKRIIAELVSSLYTIAHMVEPFIPTASKKIIDAISKFEKPETPIFDRII
jgi:methionyl-tRNA synthetase